MFYSVDGADDQIHFQDIHDTISTAECVLKLILKLAIDSSTWLPDF